MAQSLVAAPVISAAFNVGLDKAVDELLNYARNKAIDPCVLHLKVKSTMLALSVVLNDAKERQITDLAVLEWLEELTSVIYDAEDLLDDIETEALKSKIRAESQMSSSLDNVAVGNDQVPGSTNHQFLVAQWNRMISSSAVDYLNNGHVVAKLNDLCDRLAVFLSQVTVLGLRESLKITENKRSHLPFVGSIYQDTNTVSRDSDRDNIISFSRKPGVRLVIIAGSAGVGKTTLARMVYDDPGDFDIKLWVSVSAAVNSEWVINEIYSPITNKDAPTDQSEREARLNEALLGKKLLLILDNLENVKQRFWDDLCRPLKAGPKGVTIVITRSDKHVSLGNFCSPLEVQLDRLSNKDCWSLLKDVVFESEEAPINEALQESEKAPIDEALQESGKQIAAKCNGSPLAVKLLGGILRFTRDEDDWDSILRSKVWHSKCYPGDILPALRLSYSYLPSHLKRCFSYCSIFPKNYKFEKEKLVSLWIAEGFIQASKNEALLEEVGYRYFQELVNRMLFQQSSSDRSHFEMHDMVYDLAKHVSSDICFMFKADSPQVCPSKNRHFSYIQTNHDNFEYFKAIDGLGNLRTFLPLKSSLTKLSRLHIEQSFFKRFLSLRVLSLSPYDIYEIPQSLSYLKHLRFLDLSRTHIIHLSSNICTLYNLHTLLLQSCPYLTNLPEELGNLVSLRHLDMSGSKKLQRMPARIDKLNKVQTLTNFVVSEGSGAKLSALAEFHNLRGHLSISGLQNVACKREASQANMKTKMHLDELTLEWGGISLSPEMEEGICHLLQPGTSLRKIIISSYGGKKLADWIGGAASHGIVSVSLIDCHQCSCLPSLGQLPSLKKLHIANFPMLAAVGREFYAGASSSIKPFQALEILKIEDMGRWEEWSPWDVDIETFPSLQELCLKKCRKLSKHFPRNLPCLQKLEVIECDELTVLLPELPAIRNSRLQNCKILKFMSVSTLTSLVSLYIHKVSDTHLLASDLHALSSLVELNLEGLGLQNPMMLSNNDDNKQLLPGYTMLIGESIRDLSIERCAFQLICAVSSLKSLNIRQCKNLELNANCFSSLQSLGISHSDCLESFPLEIFPMLVHLKIEKCLNLRAISLPQDNILLHLFELSIIHCDNLLNFPNQGLPAPNLTLLSISKCMRLQWLPSDMNNHLTSLQRLSVKSCENLQSFQADNLPPNLHTLRIRSCRNFKLEPCETAWKAQLPASIEILDLDDPLQR